MELVRINAIKGDGFLSKLPLIDICVSYRNFAFSTTDPPSPSFGALNHVEGCAELTLVPRRVLRSRTIQLALMLTSNGWNAMSTRLEEGMPHFNTGSIAFSVHRQFWKPIDQ